MNINLEEIMRPYYEKQEKIIETKKQVEESIVKQAEDYAASNTANIRTLELRLERLRNNREQEINEYIENEIAKSPYLYATHAASIRKDLEFEYDIKEKEIQEEIERELTRQKNTSIEPIRNYYNVDVRELVELKGEIRKSLISAKRQLELNLMEIKIQHDTTMYKLSTFEYIYDESHRVQNADEFRKLYEESNRIVEAKYNYENQLKKIEEYLSVTELTTEEIKICMMSMESWEKEEYDRRKGLENVQEPVVPVIEEPVVEVTDEPVAEVTQEPIVGLIEEEPIVEVIEEEPVTEEELPFEIMEEDLLPLEDDVIDIEELEEAQEELSDVIARDLINTEEVISVPQVKYDEYDNVIVENYDDLLNHIYHDIVMSTKQLSSIKLDPSKSELPSDKLYFSEKNDLSQDYNVSGTIKSIDLPNGVYLNEQDISEGLDELEKSNKGRTFIVESIDKEFNITKKTVNMLKQTLKKCSTIKLLEQKKISNFDIKRVFGKNHSEEQVDLGNVDTNLRAGNYINLDNLFNNLSNLFVEKKENWFKQTFDKIISKEEEAKKEYKIR